VPRPARVLAVSGALVAAGVVVGGTAHAAVSDAQPVEEAVELRVQPPEHGSGIQLICMADGTVTTAAHATAAENTTTAAGSHHRTDHREADRRTRPGRWCRAPRAVLIARRCRGRIAAVSDVPVATSRHRTERPATAR
jgi:hypothetical protein